MDTTDTRGNRRQRRRSRRAGITALVAAAALIPSIAACSSGYQAKTINVYAPPDNASLIDQVGAECTATSNGAYKVVAHKLPRSADDQRLQLARRLAGNDPGLDILGMDVVWTAEFADAGWLIPVPTDVEKKIRAESLAGPIATAEHKTENDTVKRLYAIPTWTNTQLLWFRPDILQKALHRSTPPTTWDQLLAENEQIRTGWKGPGPAPSFIEVQGAQYEGLMVWFNTMLESAGGSVVDPDDPSKVTLNDTPEHKAATSKALQVMRDLARAPGSDPSLSNAKEDDGRRQQEAGLATFQINYPFVYPSMRKNSALGAVSFFPEMKKFANLYKDEDNPPKDSELGPANQLLRTKFNFGRYPAIKKSSPAKVTVGGVNFGVASTSKQHDLAFRAAQCLTSVKAQTLYGVSGGTPPTISSIYDKKEFKEAYPPSEEIRAQLQADASSNRPASPVYQSISTLITAKLSPPGSLDPQTGPDVLAKEVQKAVDGKGLIP